MNLSKEFYDYLITLVNEGYKIANKEDLVKKANILIISSGDINISTLFLKDIFSYQNNTKYTVVSQPYRVEIIKKMLCDDKIAFVSWDGKYTTSVLDMFNDDTDDFDAVLIFGNTPVDASNSNLVEIAELVIKTRDGKGCFIYSFVDNQLYEYDNVHTFFSATKVNEHINRLLEYRE